MLVINYAHGYTSPAKAANDAEPLIIAADYDSSNVEAAGSHAFRLRRRSCQGGAHLILVTRLVRSVAVCVTASNAVNQFVGGKLRAGNEAQQRTKAPGCRLSQKMQSGH